MNEVAPKEDINLLSRSILKGHIEVLHKDAVWRDKTFPDEYHLQDLLKKWFYDLKPSIKRGDKIEINISFNKDK